MRLFGSLAARLPVLTLVLVALFTAFLPSVLHAATKTKRKSPATSAYAYVGSDSRNGEGYISGFAIASDGSAQSTSGSPYRGASYSVVGGSNYLFATDGSNIATYAVASGGALHETSTVNGKAYDLDPSSSGVAGLSLAPDNRTLYTDELYFDGANSAYLAWGASANGNLSYLASPSLPPYSTAGAFPFAYSADGRFAYTWSFCNWDGSVWGFSRQANGTLHRMSTVGAQAPPPQQGQGGSYCSQAVAVSSAGYVAVAWNGGFCCGGAPVIATYALHSDGSLALVPNSEQYISCQTSPMAFDPSGHYLAVGCNGIQVYSLGAQGLLSPTGTPQQTSVPFGDLAWDNAGHLYGIPQSGWQVCQNGGSACGLYIFNANSGALSLAPGSPHTLAQPGSLAVIRP